MICSGVWRFRFMVESPAQSGRMRTLIHPGPIYGVHVTRTNGKAERHGLRPTASTSRPSERNGPMPWPSRTLRSATAGCPATCRSITGSGSTQPLAGFHLSSGPLSCSAGEPGETQHLVTRSRACLLPL